MENKIMYSIIIPTYNRRDLLERSLCSVFKSRYQNYEIIIVDDGSTDDTEDFVRKSYPSAKYVRQENKGVAAARNTGMKYAEGRYIAFLDSDDVWYPDRLSIMKDVLDNLPESVGLVFNDMDKLTGNEQSGTSYVAEYFGLQIGEYESELERRESIESRTGIVCVSYGNLFSKLIYGNIIQPSCAVIRADVFRELGGFVEKYSVAEDSEYFLRIARHKDIAYVPVILTSLEPPSLASLSNPKNNIVKIVNTIEYIDEILKTERDKGTRERLVERLSQLYALLGYHQLSDLSREGARNSSWKAISISSSNYRAYLIFILSLFPKSILSAVRKIKSIMSD